MMPATRTSTALLLAGLIASAAPAEAQTPTTVGTEFQVNTYTTNNQWRVATAASGHGDFLVAWSSTNQDGSLAGVFAQRYDSAGTAIGGEFQVNTTTAGSQTYPDVAMDADGNFLVVWSTGDIVGQRFSSSGAMVGGEFTLNSYTTGSQTQPEVDMTADGRFVVAWNSYLQDGSSWGIFGQLFDAGANPVGGELQVNTTTASYQIYPNVSIAESGEFVVVWNRGLIDVDGQRFDSSGAAVGSEFQVNTAAGVQRNADLDHELDGDFVVAWRSYGQDGDGDAVIAQRFSSTGAMVGGELQVNSYTTGSQSNPRLGRDANGNTVVIWGSLNGQDGDDTGTFGQLLDSSGTAIGSEFQVNTYTSGRQSFTAVTMDPAGNILATWVSDDPSGFDQDGDQSGVFAQRFQSPCSASFALTAGQWKMFSLPCDPGTEGTVADVIGDDMIGTYGTDWIVYERDEATGSYSALTLGSPLEMGTGYWIKTNSVGETVSMSSLSPRVTEVTLVGDADGEQNLVGHPFGFDVCWADVRILDGASVLTLDQADPIVGSMRACDMVPPDASCVMSRTMYTWNGAYSPFDGTTPGAEGTLSELDALWVRAFKNGIALRIPARAAASCGSSSFTSGSSSARQPDLAEKARPASEPWFVRLIAESEGLRDDGNLLGQLATSRRGPDLHDLKELPPFASPYLTVVFPKPDWGDHAGDYATDFHRLRRQPRRDVWRFEVRASPEIEEVTLSWDGPERIIRRLRLFDRTTGRRVPMRPDGSYTYLSDGEPRKFVCWLPGGR
ncbi:MAG: hypothetical protein AAF560_12165 [Acidobacteriota bacterium]